MIRALRLHDDGSEITPRIDEIDRSDLPDFGMEIDVSYSSINYKDALAVMNRGKIIRGSYPFVPGIDLAGTVVHCDDDAFEQGEEVIVTGWGIGENTWGGYAQAARVRPEWAVRRPEGLSAAHAMAIGTAGFTAMLSVLTLEEHQVLPETGPVVVTGASGGAGSFAVALLAAAGYEVVASTGSEDAHDYLRELGAAEIIDRHELSDGPEHPMEKGRWAGAVDAVGGKTLATLIAQTQRHGSIASYGLAGGAELHTTVFPFILRGVNLLGIDSNTCPVARRRRAWQRLTSDLDGSVIDRIVEAEIALEEVPEYSERVLSGATRGRLVVRL